ncbi:MAG: ATPase AAA [Candidatus Entotheonella factor]|uniref:ATPase AAA n=1 Tax=Entotheonella factor TaxID=1429438 RepID=W4LEV9_ENTF1|nr:MAG: ATPase AAA [Candidatus Entotheonella factor]
MIDRGNKLDALDAIRAEVSKVVLGQAALIDKLLIALLADGHILLEGAPGLAKTQIIAALGNATGGTFRRIQLLPDMLPSDITGTLIYHPDAGHFQVQKGPILDTHFLLADEINRTPPKVQAAFLQAMQEREVTLGTDTFILNDPFIVLATQNPIEEEGTYPLPEAQLDRFLFKLVVGYPDEEDELRMLDLVALDRRNPIQDVQTVTSPQELVAMREHIKEMVYVSDQIKHYIVRLVRATRQPDACPGLQDLRHVIRLGASPRGGTLNLRKACRVLAFLHGRDHVLPEDVKALALDILRHRIILDMRAEGDGITTEDVVQQILEKVEIP